MEGNSKDILIIYIGSQSTCNTYYAERITDDYSNIEHDETNLRRNANVDKFQLLLRLKRIFKFKIQNSKFKIGKLN